MPRQFVKIFAQHKARRRRCKHLVAFTYSAYCMLSTRSKTREYDSNLSCCTKTQSLLASAHCFCPCSRVWPGLQSMLCWLGLPSRMRSSHPRSGLTSERRSTSFPSFVIHHCMTLALMKLAVVHDSACDGSSFMRCCDSHCLLFKSWQHVMYLPGQFFQML